MTKSSNPPKSPGKGRSSRAPRPGATGSAAKAADAVRLRITLQYIKPAPWRVVDVPLGSALVSLHDVIQAAFGWEDCHLWQFLLAGKRAGIPDSEDPECADAGRVQLSRWLTPRAKERAYIYDFGDDWLHRIQTESRFRAEDLSALPEFVKGAWAAPPEDCGGPMGFAVLKDRNRRSPP